MKFSLRRHLILLTLFGYFAPPPALAAGECIGEDFKNCTTNSNYPFFCPGPQPGSNACCANQNACSDYLGVYASYAPWFRKSPPEIEAEKQTSPENEVNSPKFTASIFNNTLAEVVGQSALGSNNIVQGLNSAIAFMTINRPARTSEYIAYLGQKSGFQAYAANQRGGFDLLKPVQKIWIATRNIAYLITSLILIVIGFMIMLRKKIDAQTVIGVQQALPKLVVTLLLITFSYAIAGFLIDMIYFLIYLMINIAVFFKIYETPQGVTTILTQRSALGIVIRELFWAQEGVNQASDAIGAMIRGLFDDNKNAVGMIVGSVSNILAQPIAWVIVVVAILFAGFKLFFSLLMAYIQIIVGVILGPLQLMLNVLPGSDAFSKWFRNLLANTMAFPATAAMFLLGAAMMGLNKNWGVAKDIGFAPDLLPQGGFLPPFIGFGGVGDVNAVQAIIGLGIILMTPKVVDMVKEWVQAPEFKYGSAIGEAVGFGYNIGMKRPVGTGYGIYEKEKEYEKQAALFSQGRIGGQEARQQLYGVDNRAGVRAGRVKTFLRGLAIGK